MGQEKGADQTEKPTQKRLRDARKEGQVHRSQDLTRTGLILLWVLMFAMFSGYLFEHIQALFQAMFLSISHPSIETIYRSLLIAGKIFMLAILPMIIIAAFTGIFFEFLQVGPVFSFKKLVPKMENLNPANGLKRMFSQENIIEVIKSIVKTAALTLIVFLVVIASLKHYLSLSQGQVTAIWATHWHTIILVLSAVIFIFFFISVLDAIYQKHAHTKNLMMSKRDIKQEHKESDGDPLMKGQRKQLHQEWSQQNIRTSVRRSNVIVTNPTHIAVALHYQHGETDLPVVVAKGEGYIAQIIRETAEEADIPIMRNVPLARGLYSDIEIDDYITSDFFEAVVEVLRWADSLKPAE